ncbi:MAG: hypothetical protein KY454_12975 [Actinobacteria bacterium]|nr:hypothetical protein [Actinomycetota bacterium]
MTTPDMATTTGTRGAPGAALDAADTAVFVTGALVALPALLHRSRS